MYVRYARNVRLIVRMIRMLPWLPILTIFLKKKNSRDNTIVELSLKDTGTFINIYIY